jgi:serine protease Do
MKTRSLTLSFLSVTAAVGAIVALHPIYAQESSQLRRSGKIEMSVDPTQDGFDIKEIERSIRNSAKALDLDPTQQKQLEDAIQQLRDNVKQANGRFDWKWEYNSDKPSAKGSKNSVKEEDPAQRNRQRLRPQAGGQDMSPRDLFRQFFGEEEGQGGGGNPQGLDPRKLMEEMLKRMGGLNEGPNGQQQFRFKFGPNGLEPEGGQGQGQRQGPGQGQGGINPFESLRGMLGGGGLRGHEYDPSTAPHESKYSRATLAEYRSSIKDVRPSTVAILKQEKQVALGAVVTADGYIITKASELGKGDLECEFMDGKVVAAKLVTKLDQYDLALLKVEAKDLKPISFKTDDIPVGTMLVASGIDENPISVGVLSVPMRNLDESQKGFVGVGLLENPKGKGVAIGSVVVDGPGEKAGLEVNDVVLTIDGQEVNHPHELMRLIAAKGPGETVKLNVSPQQGGDPVNVEVTLSSREDYKRQLTQGFDPTAQMGSDLSNRPSNFPNALQNDLGINADQCGGPVVDIDGNVVGLNIARSGRTSTLMISGKLMKGLLAEVTTGKLNLVKDAVTLDKDLKKAEAALKAAQEALKAAQEAKAKVTQ